MWVNPRAWIRTILQLDDTPHSIALGAAIGMFIAMTPTLGIQIAIVGAVWLATHRLFTFNRMAAVVTVFVSNPITMVPLYWFNYRIGTLFMGESLSRHDFAELFEFHDGRQWWSTLIEAFAIFGAPLLWGSLIVASVAGLLTYPAMLALLRSVQGDSDPSAGAPRPN